MENSVFRLENICESCFSNHPELSDGRLHTEDGHSFDIHRFTLAKSSSYFCALYRHIGKERKDAYIPGIKGAILSSILAYIYNHNLHITQSNVCDLLVAADYLLLDELFTDIKRALPCYLSVGNCLSLFAYATLLNDSDVLREIVGFIQMHLEEIAQSDDSELNEMPLGSLKKLLSNKNLYVQDEDVIWLVIVRWVQAEILDRQSHVPDLLIHLTIVHVDEPLASRILEHTLVARNPFCKELHQMKKSNSFDSNFNVLFHYFKTHLEPNLPFYRIRPPSHLNFIAYQSIQHEILTYEIFVTFDEKIGLWRKITTIATDRPIILVALECNIYAFQNRTDAIFCYKLLEEQWVDMPIVLRLNYIVKLGGLIYALGGQKLPNGDEVSSYDPGRNVWFEVAPMFHVDEMYFEAVTLRRNIFVIGITNDLLFNMVAQSYDQENDTWLLLPTPPTWRCDFAVAAYRDRIFVIGGANADGQEKKDVEVFDPLRNEWTTKQELPYAFRRPKAVVVSDTLIVYDKFRDSPNSPVQWNDRLEYWIPIEPSSPLNDLENFVFFTLEDSEGIDRISRKNTDQKVNFVRSPFN